MFNWARIGIAVTTAVAAMAGCGLDVNVGNGNNNDNGSGQEPPARIVTVNLANLTNAAVETSLYVSTNALAAPLTDLFVPQNLYTKRVGVAATGLIPPLDVDSVDIECGDELTIGTSDALFLDQETGDELGQGNRRIVQLGLVFDCGDEITFVYDREDGEYLVDLIIE